MSSEQKRKQFNTGQRMRIAICAAPYLALKAVSWLTWDGQRLVTYSLASWVDDKLTDLSILADRVMRGMVKWAHKERSPND